MRLFTSCIQLLEPALSAIKKKKLIKIAGNVYGGVATPLAMLHNNGETPPRRVMSRPQMAEPSRNPAPRLPVLRETHCDNGHCRGECEPLLPLSNSVAKIIPNSSNSKFSYSNNFNENSYNNGPSVNYNFNNTNSSKSFDSPKSKLGHFENVNWGNNSNSNSSNNGYSYVPNGLSGKGNGHFNINSNGLMCKKNVVDDNQPPPLPPHKPIARGQQTPSSRYPSPQIYYIILIDNNKIILLFLRHSSSPWSDSSSRITNNLQKSSEPYLRPLPKPPGYSPKHRAPPLPPQGHTFLPSLGSREHR